MRSSISAHAATTSRWSTSHPCRSSRVRRTASMPLRTTSGCFDATPFVIVCSGRASRWSSGPRRDHCNPFWRRCGNSGVTPGTRALDHGAARARRARRSGRVRGGDGRTARAGRTRRGNTRTGPARGCDRASVADPRAVGDLRHGGRLRGRPRGDERRRRLGGRDRRAAPARGRARHVVDRARRPHRRGAVADAAANRDAGPPWRRARC